MDDIKIRVIDSNKLIDAINAGSYDINLSAVMALGAVVVGKEIPKKPIEKRIENGDQTQVLDVCPICGSPDIDKECGDYCPKCGQKLDWEEKDDNIRS